MPTAPPTRCTYPGCGALTSHGRCELHERKPWENKSANSRALSGADRNRINKEQLRREPQCRNCGSTRFLRADHIIEIADGGSVWDPQNWQTLCEGCHDIKSEDARRRRRRERQSPR
jgi:5-methylcytosine-specific restriction protein A